MCDGRKASGQNLLITLVTAEWSATKLLLPSEDDEAELYDPDDPNSDWGQAVQEALQERHLLVLSM